MRKLTTDDVLELRPCKKYTRGYLEELFAGRKMLTIIDVMGMEAVPPVDVVWLFCRVAETNRQKVVFSLKCATDAGYSARAASADSAASADWAARAARADCYERQLLFICETICEEEGYEIEI